MTETAVFVKNASRYSTPVSDIAQLTAVSRLCHCSDLDALRIIILTPLRSSVGRDKVESVRRDCRVVQATREKGRLEKNYSSHWRERTRLK